MKKKVEELIIEELDVNDDIKNNLNSFESFINKLNKKIKSNINFSIVIFVSDSLDFIETNANFKSRN